MEPKIFYRKEIFGNDFKIYEDKGELIFLALDVAKWIGHSNIRCMLRNISTEEQMHKIVHLDRQKKVRKFLTEKGLYEALMQNRKEISYKFEKEIIKILNNIRSGEDLIMEQTELDFDSIKNETSLITQTNSLFGEVRFLEVDGKPYAVGRDVANALGYANSSKAVLTHCKNGIKQMIAHSQNGNMVKTQTTLIPEGDIYRLIVRSKLPQAELFEKWVFDEVIPQIRQTGGYIKVSDNETDEEIMAKALMVAQNTLNKKNELLKAKEQELTETKSELETKNKFMHQISVSENSILVRELAKVASKNGIVIGEKRLWNKLREWGIIFKNSTEPKQSAVDKGYFEVASGTREAKGNIFTYQTTRVTGKGQIYIINRLLKND